MSQQQLDYLTLTFMTFGFFLILFIIFKGKIH
jgi:hypothetical protein